MKHHTLGIAVVSAFPFGKGTHENLDGTASYTKNFIQSLAGISDDVRILVFSNSPTDSNGITPPLPSHDSLAKESPQHRYRHTLEVVRCWHKGPFCFFHLLRALFIKRNVFDIIHIQHEYSLFGSSLSALLFPVFLLLIRLLNKRIVVTMHGVVCEVDATDKFREQHFVGVHLRLLMIGFSFINRSIFLLSDRVIVHSEYFKKRIEKNYLEQGTKIHVVPHGIENREDLVERRTAKEILDTTEKHVLLFFGYLAGYKGIELLIEAFGHLTRDEYILFIAGGEAVRLRDSLRYKQYLRSLRSSANGVDKEGIVFSGFVNEERIPVYFSAADLVIFPYPEAYACSGPFSLCITYKRPFLVSRALAEVYSCPDELSFEQDPVSLGHTISRYFSSEEYLRKSMAWIEEVRRSQLWEALGNTYRELYRSLTH